MLVNKMSQGIDSFFFLKQKLFVLKSTNKIIIGDAKFVDKNYLSLMLNKLELYIITAWLNMSNTEGRDVCCHTLENAN